MLLLATPCRDHRTGKGWKSRRGEEPTEPTTHPSLLPRLLEPLLSLLTNYWTKKQNKVIFREGDPGDRFYIILDGEVCAFASFSHSLPLHTRFLFALASSSHWLHLRIGFIFASPSSHLCFRVFFRFCSRRPQVCIFKDKVKKDVFGEDGALIVFPKEVLSQLYFSMH